MILRSPNTDRLIDGKPRTYLSAASAAASGTFTVESISGFSVGNMLIVGVIGEERTEVLRVHTSSAPSGSTITLNANSAYRHEVGTPVYFVDFDQVEFSRSTTETGSKSVLATSTMTPDMMDTIYDDLTNTTGYGFTRFKNSASATFSGYYDAIPYAGYSLDACASIFDRALSMAGARISPRLKYEDMFRFLNDFVSYANQKNTRWSESKSLNYLVDTVSTGDWEFVMPATISKNTDPSAVIALRVRGFVPLTYVSQRQWDQLTRDLRFTTLAADVAVIDTTITLSNSYDFPDSGSIEIEGDSIAYTGNTRATGTLTGVTAISAVHSSGAYIFSAVNFIKGDPLWYTVPSPGYFRVWPVCGTNSNNRLLYSDFYRIIPNVNSLGDKIYLTRNLAAIQYMAYRIKKWLASGTLSAKDEDFQQFAAAMTESVNRDMPSEPIRLSTR